MGSVKLGIIILSVYVGNGINVDPRQEALQKIALRCRTDLYFLAKEILGYDKMTEATHGELCHYTENILPNHAGIATKEFDPRKNLLLLLMPRGTFKSSVVTIGFTLQYFLNEPDARILIDSETFGKSKAFLREVIGHLTGNPQYREVFRAIHGVYPDGEGKRDKNLLWTDAQLNLACRKKERKEPSLSCSGIDRSINGMHFDLIICDDLHSEKNVTNREQIQQVIDHYKLAFSLLDPGQPMIVIGTRWDYNDLYQHILDFEKEDFNILKKSAYNPDGSLFFPEVLSEVELDKIRRRQGASIFSKQYLNEPVSDENAEFRREYIKRVPLEKIKGRPINWYLSVDPSYADPRHPNTSDFAGFVLAGMDYMRDIYIRYIVRKKMMYSEVINEMFKLYTDPLFKDIKNMKIILEVIGTKSLSYELANEQKRRNTWLPVTEIKGARDNKEERIRGLKPFYEYGHVYHVQECPQIEELEYELLHFPTGRHDDIIDPLATILEFASPPTNKAHFEEDDPRSRKRVRFKPRSPITNT